MDRPGREIPKDYRKVVTYLIEVQGWCYEASGKKHPVIVPPDQEKPVVRIPTTPTRSLRAFQNWLAEIRRAGGRWPPERQSPGDIQEQGREVAEEERDEQGYMVERALGVGCAVSKGTYRSFR